MIAIIGIAVGAFVVLLIVIIVIVLALRSSKKGNQDDNNNKPGLFFSISVMIKCFCKLTIYHILTVELAATVQPSASRTTSFSPPTQANDNDQASVSMPSSNYGAAPAFADAHYGESSLAK